MQRSIKLLEPLQQLLAYREAIGIILKFYLYSSEVVCYVFRAFSLFAHRRPSIACYFAKNLFRSVFFFSSEIGQLLTLWFLGADNLRK